MYRGFNLTLEKASFEQQQFETLRKTGSKSLTKHRKQIKETIASFVGVDGSLDGSKLKANWFPQIKADVFISHSHKDKELAIALAGWLKETFGLTAFIDSYVWGYANELLRQIDNKYCRMRNGYYDYEKRNYSTSHVHMMLSVALAQMIDNTECLFFLNTPQSITPNSDIEKTTSPWIYSEIAMSWLIRKKNPQEHRALNESIQTFSRGGSINIKYDLPLDHLIDIDESHLIDWSERVQGKFIGLKEYILGKGYSHPLDALYSLTNQQDGQR